MSRVQAGKLGSNSQRAPFSRWVGSLVGMTGLLLGVPALFVVLGVVPPLVQLGHVVARPELIVHHLNRPLSDATVADSVAMAAWVAWLWLVFCVVVEIVATVRGRPTLRLPASRHVQSLVTTLVGASMAVIPIGKSLPMRLMTAPTAVHSVTLSPQAGIGSRFSDVTWGDSNGVVTGSAQGPVLVPVDNAIPSPMMAPLYMVKRGDTLWSIAETELGSPLRWRDIADLNYGRVQSDGSALTDAHWIYPGWELELPAGASGVSPTAAAQMRVSTTSTPPLPVPPPTAVPVVAQPPTTERLALPDPVQLASGRSGSDVHESRSSSDPSPPHAAERADGDPTEHSPVPVGAIGYGILGAGVLALLERLRRVQRRHRPGGLRIALPHGDLAALEQRLRSDSDPEGADFIDLGLRALVLYSLQSEMAPPLATLCRLSGQFLEVVLDPGSESRTPPEPFTVNTPTTNWLLVRDSAIVQTLRRDFSLTEMDPPFPALVTVGHDASGLLLVDLEQAASVDVTGTNAKAILGAMAVEMATAKWADQVEIILVGFDGELESLDRVVHVPTIAEVASKAQRRVRERKALLASVGRDANWEIRWAEGGDSWDLCLIICSSSAVEADADGAAAIVQAAGKGGYGLAVVMGSATGMARWHLSALGRQVALEMTGGQTTVFAVEPVDLQLTADIGSLVEVASRLYGVLPTDPPYDRIEESGTEGDREVLGGEDAAPLSEQEESQPPIDLTPESTGDPEVEVRVLGSIEIVGAARPFNRAWSIELIVYLAMHRKGASSEQWATALWPDRIMAPASLHSTASSARRSLGVSISGEDHLPRAHGRLSLGSSVDSDWNRFSDLSKTMEPESWHQALALIRGRPFEGLRAADWVLLEGIAANIEAVVVDLAVRYAEHCLSVGDSNGAEWSARQGLLVSAYDERLYRMLLRAADLAGNPAGVESVMAELVRLVAEDVEPYDAVHPETFDLYRSLSRRPAHSLKR